MLWQEEDILAGKYKVIRALDSKNTPHKTYKIYDINWDKPFRLKSFCPSFYQTNADKKLLYYFLKKWISLSGSYEITNAYYVREIQGHVCIITEYIEGCNLRQYQEFLDAKLAIDIAIKVAFALKHAAKVKMIHGNLKFENILIAKNQEQNIRVTDFLHFKSTEHDQNILNYRAFLDELFSAIKDDSEFVSKAREIIENTNDLSCFAQQLQQVYEETTSTTYLEPVKSSRFEIEQSNKQALSYLESNEKERALQLWMANMTKTPPSISATWNWHLLNLRNGLQTLDQFLDETEHLTEQDFQRIACAKAQLALQTGILVDECLEEILLLHEQTTKTLSSQRLEGELFFYLNEYDKAIESFSELLRQENCEGDDWYRLGAAFFASGDTDNAFSIWQDGNIKHPNHLLLLLGKATYLFHSGKLDEVEELLLFLANKYPDIFWANLHVAEFFSGQGVYEREVENDSLNKAVFYYKRIIEKNPNMIRAIRGFHYCSKEQIPEVESPDTLEGWMQFTYFDHPENLITALSMSHDAGLIASGDCEGNIIVWDVVNEIPLFIFSEHAKHISDLVFNNAGDKLISSSWDNSIRVWDVLSGECLQTLSEHSDRISSVDICENLVVSGSWDGTAKIWDIANGQCLATIDSGSGWITDVSFCDTKRVVLCDENENMSMWEIDMQQQIQKMQGSSTVVSSNTIVSTDSDAIYVWDCQTGDLLSQIDTYDREMGICLSKDGHFLLTRNEDEMLKIWYLPGKYCITILYNEEALCGAMTKDVKVLVSANGTTISVWNNIFEQFFPLRRIATFLQPKSSFIAVPSLIPQKISTAQKFYQQQNYKEAYDTYRSLQRIPGYEATSKIICGVHQSAKNAHLPIEGVRNCILRKAVHFPYQIWHLDGVSANMAIFSCGNDPLRIWNLETDFSLEELHGHSRAISALAVHHQNNYAISGSWDKTVRVWNLNNAKEHGVISLHRSNITSVAISVCEKYTASADRKGNVYIWDIEQKSIIAEYVHDITVSRVIFVNETILMICDISGYLYFWNFIEKEIRDKIRPHDRYLLDICLSHDKKSFAVTSRNKKVSLYQVDDLSKMIEIETEDILKHIHMTADKSVVIGSTYTGKIQMWRMSDQKCLHEFQAHYSEIRCCKVIDDQFLITVNDSGEICLFEIDWDWK